MKWNKTISALLLPLVIYTFAEAGHFCLSMLTARVNPDTPCCCRTHEDASSSAQQKSCCDQEDQKCRCSMTNSDMPVQAAVINTHIVDAIVYAHALCTPDLHNISHSPNGDFIILSEPVPCFAATHWRKIRLTC